MGSITPGKMAGLPRISLGTGHYQQAQQVLKQILAQWSSLPAQERQRFQKELGSLQSLQSKLEQRLVSIAVFGMVNRGKSAVLNALLGKPVLQMGPLNGVTRSPFTVSWAVQNRSGAGALGLRIKLIDTPGLNEVNGQIREQLAWNVAQTADLILFVIAGDITQIEYQALLELRTLQKPILLVFNKIDLYPDHDQQAIYNQITSPRLRQLVSPEEIVMVAAAPTPVKVRVHWPDGQVTYEWERPDSLVDRLRQKILQVLEQEGESLLALNVLLRVSQLHERLLQRHLYQTHPAAQSLLWRVMSGKALLISFSSFLLLDLLISVGSDLGLLLCRSRLAHLPLTDYRLRQFLQKLGSSVGLLALAELGSGWLFHSPLNGGAAAPVTFLAYWGVALLQAGVAATTTRWIDQSAETYLLEGSRRGATAPRTVAEQILAELKPGSILNRLKQEVSLQLGMLQP
jgi:hypothetical protein